MLTKKMKIEVDQSGKVEDTAKDTILCLSNSEWYSVKIPSTVKRQLQERFRRNGQIRNFVLFTFCAGLVYLLKSAKPKTKVTIDREYIGREAVIKKLIEEMLSKSLPLLVIEFALIGKSSNAHLIAKEIATGKLNPTLTLKEGDLLKTIKKTEVGKRLKDA